jgi:hypothetical protein
MATATATAAIATMTTALRVTPEMAAAQDDTLEEPAARHHPRISSIACGLRSGTAVASLKKAVITEPRDNRLQNLPDGTKKPSQTEKHP